MPPASLFVSMQQVSRRMYQAAGATIALCRPGGGAIDVAISEVKWFDSTCTFYLEGVSLADARVGSELRWEAMPRASRKGKRVAQRR